MKTTVRLRFSVVCSGLRRFWWHSLKLPSAAALAINIQRRWRHRGPIIIIGLIARQVTESVAEYDVNDATLLRLKNADRWQRTLLLEKGDLGCYTGGGGRLQALLPSAIVWRNRPRLVNALATDQWCRHTLTALSARLFPALGSGEIDRGCVMHEQASNNG